MRVDLNYQPAPEFPERYISPEKLFLFLQKKYGAYIKEIGKSAGGRPVYLGSFGTGPVKVIAWSQMHGNESTATLAMLDLLNSVPLNNGLFSRIKLDFIFMLNPEGSEKWTRLNAQELDINRDFNAEETVEMRLLKETVSKSKYDFALNLHDQRTIFTTDDLHPATLSFLSPSQDVLRTLTEGRKKSMAVISYIYEELKEILPDRIARYSDEFYPNSCGDNFMRAGLPNILFEGGHYENDYQRTETRKYYTMALFKALEGIAELNLETTGYQTYFLIPENKESHYDLVYRNVELQTDFSCTLDIGVQYREVFNGGPDIEFVPYVAEVGSVSRTGWKEVDCTGRTFISKSKYPKLDEPVNFQIV